MSVYSQIGSKYQCIFIIKLILNRQFTLKYGLRSWANSLLSLLPCEGNISNKISIHTVSSTHEYQGPSLITRLGRAGNEGEARGSQYRLDHQLYKGFTHSSGVISYSYSLIETQRDSGRHPIISFCTCMYFLCIL